MKLIFKGRNYLSSAYGNRILNGQNNWHSGLDLVGQDSKVIYAPCDGIISASTIITDKSNRTWEWGNYIRLDGEGYQIYMCHMSMRLVEAGTHVKQGEPIGIMGNTGYSFGEHCHFEIRQNGVAVNPANILHINNIAGTVYQNSFDIPKKENEDMTKEQVMELIKTSGKEIYEAMKDYLKEQPVPDWAKDELQEAIDMGITDGTRPMDLTPRFQTAIMTKRVADKNK